MPNRYATQGALLAEQLKKYPHTYMEMYSYGLSTCPHKRLAEWERLHGDKWRIVKGRRYEGQGKYLTTWAVKRAQ